MSEQNQNALAILYGALEFLENGQAEELKAVLVEAIEYLEGK